MDHKAWSWKKRSSEKSILASDKANQSHKGNEEEIHTLLANKGELENDLKILKDKLSSALSECSDKDELIKRREMMMQESVVGWEKARAEIVSLRQELDAALQHRVVAEERSTQLDAALRECMQQLQFVRGEQEQRIHDTVNKVSKEYEKSLMLLEEKLADTSKRLGKVGVENTSIRKALLVKEKLMEDLTKQRAQMEADISAVMTRLDSKEKENSALKYEVRVLEKELEIRNEEREFNRRSSEASHKQYLDSVKKIAKLETECQRLRVLVRKRLPGPAALAKMKNEAQILGRDSTEIKRRKSDVGCADIMNDYAADAYQGSPGKRMNVLMEQLFAIEEENKVLKEALSNKLTEIHFSRVINAQIASKSPEVESLLEESPKCLTNTDPTMKILHQISLASTSDISSNDKASCSESWASALNSELEHSRKGRLREQPSYASVGSSDINLMDDFVEMEKLALVSDDKPSGNDASSEGANTATGPSGDGAREIVALPDSQAGWLQEVLKIIMEQNSATKRNLGNILEDIRKALSHNSHPKPGEFLDEREKPSGGSSMMDSSGGIAADTSFVEKSSPHFQPDVSKSFSRIIELIEGINLPSPDYIIPEKSKEGNHFLEKQSETPSGYMVRVFQWKTSELSAVLQQFLHACYDLSSGKIDFNKFSQELTVALDWIINHCFSIQDVSSMRDEIKKNLDWDESESESDAEVEVSHFAETDKLHVVAHHQNALFQADNEDLEEKLDLTINQREFLINQLEESEKSIEDLQTELESLKKAEGKVDSQVEKHTAINEDLDTAVTKVDLIKNSEVLPLAELEAESKSICHVEPEATCLRSFTKEISVPDSELRQEGKQLRADWEITAASEKLAECQETILNLGKQLKALASPKDAVLFNKVISSPSHTTRNESDIKKFNQATSKVEQIDKVISNPSKTITTASATPSKPAKKMSNRKSSLLDQMLAEDSSKESHGNSAPPRISTEILESLEKILVLNGSRNQDEDASVKALPIVPSKKRGRSLWRRLLWRKKSRSEKTSLPVAPPQLIS